MISVFYWIYTTGTIKTGVTFQTMVTYETSPFIHLSFTNSEKHVFIRSTHKQDSYGHSVFPSDFLFLEKQQQKGISSIEKWGKFMCHSSSSWLKSCEDKIQERKRPRKKIDRKCEKKRNSRYNHQHTPRIEMDICLLWK